MLLIHLIRLDVSGMKDLSHSHRCYRFSVSFPQRERQNGNSFHYLAPRPEAPLWNMLIRLADFKCWREAGCSASDGSSNGLFGYCTCCRHSVNCGSLGKQTASIKYCKSSVCVILWGPECLKVWKQQLWKGPRSRVSSGIGGTCSALVCLNIHVLMLIFAWGDRAIRSRLKDGLHWI